MKHLLLASAAFLALSTASYAADMPAVAPEEMAVVESDWSGFFVGIQGGYAFADLGLDFEDDDIGGVVDEDELDIDADGFLIGLYYGRNWQSGNWVYGLDSSISYFDMDGDDGEDDDLDIGDDDGDLALIDGVEVEADILGLSRLKVGYAFGDFLVFATGGLATTHFDISTDIDGDDDDLDDDSFGFGFTLGAGVETMISENWSARVEYIYADIEDDFDFDDDVDVDFGTDLELEAHIVRGGIAYHF